MPPYKTATRLLAFVFAIGLLGHFVTSASAAVVHKVDKDSQFAGHFKVTKDKLNDKVRITVTAPKTLEGYNLDSLRYSINGQIRTMTNGNELSFLIDPDKLDKAIVYADYTDPNHNPEETGGLAVYMLNLSSLAVEAE